MNLATLKKAMLTLRGGDISALETIYEETRRGVFTFVLPIVNNYQEAEDIMQSTYVRLYENIGQYDENKNPLNWILTIAKNLALTDLAKTKRETACDFNDELHTNDIVTNMPEIDTPIINLANQVLEEEEFHIVMLYIIGEYKHREIAEILSLPLGTVTWKYNNALKKLKVEVKKKGLEK